MSENIHQLRFESQIKSTPQLTRHLMDCFKCHGPSPVARWLRDLEQELILKNKTHKTLPNGRQNFIRKQNDGE